jgi:cell wall-associated NlpC family hydrolase
MPIKTGYLIAASGGAILLWSGIKGKKWSTVLRDLISGRPISSATDNPITGTPASDFAAGANAGVTAQGKASAQGSAIADDALKYQGAGYVWGGTPGSGSGHWDCSSFANAVIGRDIGMAIPMYRAGAYIGQSHGPTTGVWLVWPGAFTIKRKDAAPGDLCIWQTHMGICIGGGRMISALDQASGTQVTTFAAGAPTGEIMFVRRLKAAIQLCQRWLLE